MAAGGVGRGWGGGGGGWRVGRARARGGGGAAHAPDHRASLAGPPPRSAAVSCCLGGDGVFCPAISMGGVLLGEPAAFAPAPCPLDDPALRGPFLAGAPPSRWPRRCKFPRACLPAPRCKILPRPAICPLMCCWRSCKPGCKPCRAGRKIERVAATKLGHMGLAAAFCHNLCLVPGAACAIVFDDAGGGRVCGQR